MKFSARRLSRMRKVLLDPEASGPLFLYFMARGLPWPKRNKLRTDLTILLPCVLGREYSKTFGHYHQPQAKEIYKVLLGQGLFLFQKGKEVIGDICFVAVERRDEVKIPPGYAHTTINTGVAPLVTLNFSDPQVRNDYKPIEEKRGFGYYVVKGKDREVEFVRNKNYEGVPEIRELRIKNKELRK